MASTRLRRQVLVALGLLVGMQLVTALATISVFRRMSPSVARIVQENVYSIDAVESMLEALAVAPAAGPSARQQFQQSLARAKSNITEAEEAEPLAAIGRLQDAALRGDATAIREAAHALRRLGTANQAAVQRTDETVRQLAAAGAWSEVFLGLAGLGLGLILYREARRRTLDPFEDLLAVARAWRSGDHQRRCRISDGSPELGELAVAVNGLLDRQQGRTAAPDDGRTCQLLRAVLVTALDQHQGPVAVVATEGTLVAANQAALALLAGARGAALRAALREAPATAHPGAGLRRIATVGEGEAFICAL